MAIFSLLMASVLHLLNIEVVRLMNTRHLRHQAPISDHWAPKYGNSSIHQNKPAKFTQLLFTTYMYVHTYVVHIFRQICFFQDFKNFTFILHRAQLKRPTEIQNKTYTSYFPEIVQLHTMNKLLLSGWPHPINTCLFLLPMFCLVRTFK